MFRPPGDPEFRSDLPKLESERRPYGYRAGLQLEERLQGLGAVALGVVGLLVAYAIFTGLLPFGLRPPPPPPGVLVQAPLINPAACVAPLMAFGSIALIVVGFRRVVDP
ncbi:MAG: hypothetical protein JO352_30765 [Chloroflexi bacterium]|nr:hypothetical protein [Chloroflexota bacterium]MBV9596728.1 hypothetical protein [Chloroflexota bacterium]